MIGLVWASSEADIAAAGGWAVAEGYHTMQFAGAGDDYPVLPGNQGDVQKARQGAAEGDGDTVILQPRHPGRGGACRGDAQRAQATGGKKPTGEDVKKGFEMIQDFTLGGLVPPLKITPTDHEGGGWVQIFQVKGGKFVKETEWFRGYPRGRAPERCIVMTVS